MTAAAKSNHHVNGDRLAKQEYELRINGEPVERSVNVVDLYWKARRAVNGTTAFADVEAVSGFYSHAMFSDSILQDWERA